MKIEKELKGQFPSKNCDCHFQEPFGFVPAADCPEHDTIQFMDFMELITSKATKRQGDIILKEIEKIKL